MTVKTHIKNITPHPPPPSNNFSIPSNIHILLFFFPLSPPSVGGVHIFVISGPSRSGKNTIAKELLKDRTLNLAQAITCTTRPPRENEKNGVDYYFLSSSQFQEMIDNDGFI